MWSWNIYIDKLLIFGLYFLFNFNIVLNDTRKVTKVGNGLIMSRRIFGNVFAAENLTFKKLSNKVTRTTDKINN